jgi:hypothetical protein
LILDKQIQQMAEREVARAIYADEQSNANYHQTLKRFVPGISTESQARLDSSGLKEIDTAWLKINDTGKKLRRAYMKLYDTYI